MVARLLGCVGVCAVALAMVQPVAAEPGSATAASGDGPASPVSAISFEFGLATVSGRLPAELGGPGRALRGEGRGGSLRALAGKHGTYGGLELGIARLDATEWSDGPSIASPRTSLPPRSAAAVPGATLQVRAVVGRSLWLGPLSVGGELGVGFEGVFLAATEQASAREAGRWLLDGRARTSVWLSDHVSVSALLGTSLVRMDEQHVITQLGFSSVRW